MASCCRFFLRCFSCSSSEEVYCELNEDHTPPLLENEGGSEDCGISSSEKENDKCFKELTEDPSTPLLENEGRSEDFGISSHSEENHYLRLGNVKRTSHRY